jgi:type II secretory pathway component PulF
MIGRDIKTLIEWVPSGRELGVLYRNLRFLIGAGVGLPKSFASLSQQYRRSHLALYRVVQSLDQAVGKGLRLHVGFSAHPDLIPDYHRRLIDAGEKSGYLLPVLRELQDSCERLQILTLKIVSMSFQPFLYLNVGMLFFGILTTLNTDWGLFRSFLPLILLYLVIALGIATWKIARLGRMRRSLLALLKIFEGGDAFEARNLSRFVLIIRIGYAAGISTEIQQKLAFAGTEFKSGVYEMFYACMKQTGQYSLALGRCFGMKQIYLQMISAGEKSGGLDHSLLEVYSMLSLDYFHLLSRRILLVGLLVHGLSVMVAFKLIL